MSDERLVQLLDLPNTYIGEAPIGTNSCQWVSLSSGMSKSFFGRNTIDSPEYVVYIRDTKNAEASRRAQECFKKIQNWSDGTVALKVSRLPTYVGRDEKHRSVYSFRVQFIIGG